jgi:hypothetical protein
MLPEPISVTMQVIRHLDHLKIPYFIGGSLATAVYGLSRATLDADLVVDLKIEQVQELADRLEDVFYVDRLMMIDALIHFNSFNVIHRDTMFKVDIFVQQDSAYAATQFSRRVPLDIETGSPVYFASPEDVILAKLDWYRQGGGTSSRQWEDIKSILQVQGERLDQNYLQTWANQLGLESLYQRILQEI